jgi:hypothetical protein
MKVSKFLFQLDITIADFGSNNVGVLLGYSNSSFASQTTDSTDSVPQFVAVGDFNNDKKLDFATINEGTDSLQILLRTC